MDRLSDLRLTDEYLEFEGNRKNDCHICGGKRLERMRMRRRAERGCSQSLGNRGNTTPSATAGIGPGLALDRRIVNKPSGRSSDLKDIGTRQPRLFAEQTYRLTVVCKWITPMEDLNRLVLMIIAQIRCEF